MWKAAVFTKLRLALECTWIGRSKAMENRAHFSRAAKRYYATCDNSSQALLILTWARKHEVLSSLEEEPSDRLWMQTRVSKSDVYICVGHLVLQASTAIHSYAPEYKPNALEIQTQNILSIHEKNILNFVSINWPRILFAKYKSGIVVHFKGKNRGWCVFFLLFRRSHLGYPMQNERNFEFCVIR